MEDDKETQEANDQSQTGEGEKVPAENTSDRVSSEQVGKAKQTSKELKKENDEVEKELLRKEKLEERMALGGQTDAGQIPKKETEDEKWAKESKERYEGTGMDPTPDDTPTQFI